MKQIKRILLASVVAFAALALQTATLAAEKSQAVASAHHFDGTEPMPPYPHLDGTEPMPPYPHLDGTEPMPPYPHLDGTEPMPPYPH